MVWTIMKPETKRLNKDTRWDRIRKKHTNNLNMKSTFVKKFVEMDFIGKNNTKLLNGDTDVAPPLDPTLVMNLRHQMFQKKPRASPPCVEKYKVNIDKCIVHNLEVEERYIRNELSKFRAQLRKNRLQCKIRPTILNNDKYTLSNKTILRSLEKANRHIKDFYEAPLEAMEKLTDHKTVDCNAVTNGLECTQETYVMSTTCNENENKEMRCVRFNDFVGVVKYDPSMKGSQVSLMEVNQHENPEGHCAVFYDSTDIGMYDVQESSSNEESEYPLIEVSQRAKMSDAGLELEISVEMVDQNRLDTSDVFSSVISNLTEEALNEVQVENSVENIQIKGTSVQSQSITNPLVVTKILPERAVETDLNRPPSVSEDDDESVSNEQKALVEQLFQAKEHANSAIVKKYFLKWTYFTTIQKIERQNVTTKNDRIFKINAFLDYIRREKRKLAEQALVPTSETRVKTLNVTKKYQTKIKIQQDIIDLQKMKLQRQERLITELKLTKLCEEAKEDRKEIKAELKNALRSVDSKSRAKVRCLQLMGNLGDEEDQDIFARLQGKAIEHPNFLTSMQERAIERSLKHELAKQRRLQQESEREAAKLAMEEAKRLEDEEAKRMRIELLKEKRRQEKMAKILKERERQAIIDNNIRADQFCRLYHLRKAMIGFKQVLERKHAMQKKVQLLRKRLIMKNAFVVWKNIYLLRRERKFNLADEMYERHVKRRAFQGWTLYVRGERSNYLVAVDWHELKLSQVIFSRWQAHTHMQKILEDVKIKKAELHYEWHLKWKVVEHWQRLPQILQQEKETEERRQRWRLKIWELLPDYKPNRDQL